jgi:hypothetical protein
MDPATLYDQPFTNFNPTGPEGMFADVDIQKMITTLRGVNTNAGMFVEGA